MTSQSSADPQSQPSRDFFASSPSATPSSPVKGVSSQVKALSPTHEEVVPGEAAAPGQAEEEEGGDAEDFSIVGSTSAAAESSSSRRQQPRRAAVENAKPLFLVDEDEDVADWVNGDDDDEGADFFSTQPSNVAKAKPRAKPTSDDEDFEPASIDVDSHQHSSPPSSEPALAQKRSTPAHTSTMPTGASKRLKQSSPSPSAVAVEANRKPRSQSHRSPYASSISSCSNSASGHKP